VYNIAFGDRNTLNDLVGYLKEYLSKFDAAINQIEIKHGPQRIGDIPHSHADIGKAKKLLNYNPTFSLSEGLKEAVQWYWKNIENESN
jgi:UDP-N-acetylglucosamine 4-epimerase